jgi:hypothetical protein
VTARIFQVEPAADETPPLPDFTTLDVVAIGGARLVLINNAQHVNVSARLADGTAVPLAFHALSQTSSTALIVLSGDQIRDGLTITGHAADGSSLGSDTVDLASASITGQHQPAFERRG